MSLETLQGILKYAVIKLIITLFIVVVSLRDEEIFFLVTRWRVVEGQGKVKLCLKKELLYIPSGLFN